MGKFKDYYSVLGVAPRSHARVIEERYWEQAHELHNVPTRRAVKQLRSVNEAYEVLGSPHKREHYDLERAQFVESEQRPQQSSFLHAFVNLVGRAFRPD